MQQISRRRRLWLATAVAATAVTGAGALAFAAGPTSSHAQTQQRPPIRHGIDDTLPQGPSDPAGLLGVPVRAEEGTTR